MRLFCGPCVIESREATLRMAERLRKVTEGRSFDFVFKASFDKANRTSVESFRGPGLEAGLKILDEVRREVGVPVNTDVHEVGQVDAVAAAVDTLQVPALLCRQTDLLVAVGAAGKPVLLKKGQFMAPEDMRHAVAKVRAGGAAEVLVCERGTSFGHKNLVVDFRGLPVMRAIAPVVFDGTHSVQRPAAQGHASDGDREMIPVLVRAAVAVGVDGLFLESHEDPDRAKCDGPNQIPLDELPALLDQVERIRDAVA